MANDLLIFYQDQEQQVSGICIIADGEFWKLVRLVSRDYDRRFSWISIGFDENTDGLDQGYFEMLPVERGSIRGEFILASAIALKRTLSI